MFPRHRNGSKRGPCLGQGRISPRGACRPSCQRRLLATRRCGLRFHAFGAIVGRVIDRPRHATVGLHELASHIATSYACATFLPGPSGRRPSCTRCRPRSLSTPPFWVAAVAHTPTACLSLFGSPTSTLACSAGALIPVPPGGGSKVRLPRDWRAAASVLPTTACAGSTVGLRNRAVPREHTDRCSSGPRLPRSRPTRSPHPDRVSPHPPRRTGIRSHHPCRTNGDMAWDRKPVVVPIHSARSDDFDRSPSVANASSARVARSDPRVVSNLIVAAFRSTLSS